MIVYDVSQIHTTTNPILEELRQLWQWLPWRYMWNQRSKKYDKVPIDPRTHRGAEWQKPDVWCGFNEAVRYAKAHKCDGVGIVVTQGDSYCFIDIDKCRDPKTGELSLGVQEIIDKLDSYTEISPSGTGIRIIVRATKPGDKCKTKDTPWGGNLELYDRNQFLTVTGNVYHDAPIRDAQETIDDLYERFFGEDEPEDRTEAKFSSSGQILDDDEVRELARNCSKTGKRFARLEDRSWPAPPRLFFNLVPIPSAGW